VNAVGVWQAGQVSPCLGDRMVGLEAGGADQRGEIGDGVDSGVGAGCSADSGGKVGAGVAGDGQPRCSDRSEQAGGELGVGAAQDDQCVVTDPEQDAGLEPGGQACVTRSCTPATVPRAVAVTSGRSLAK
jgi:hypothetical protein